MNLVRDQPRSSLLRRNCQTASSSSASLASRRPRPWRSAHNSPTAAMSCPARIALITSANSSRAAKTSARVSLSLIALLSRVFGWPIYPSYIVQRVARIRVLRAVACQRERARLPRGVRSSRRLSRARSARRPAAKRNRMLLPWSDARRQVRNNSGLKPMR
jgi:hypothetical protein